MKNRTIKQRILGSFAAILALMALMAGVAYMRLAAIDEETNSLQTDSTPGLYYSTMINAAWFENHMLIQQLTEFDNNEDAQKRDLMRLQQSAAKLDGLVRDYDATISRANDRALFNEFKNVRAQYGRIQADILKLDASRKNAAAHSLFAEQLKPAWDAGDALIQKVVGMNKVFGDRSEE